MSRKPTSEPDAERAAEARHLAEDALEAADQGEAEEARFLAGEAKSLDPDAAADTLGGTPLDKNKQRSKP